MNSDELLIGVLITDKNANLHLLIGVLITDKNANLHTNSYLYKIVEKGERSAAFNSAKVP